MNIYAYLNGLQAKVNALREVQSATGEVDGVIESAGGWPIK